jgi:hypothetical protein
MVEMGDDRWKWMQQVALDNIDEIRKRPSKAVVEQLLAAARLYEMAERRLGVET